MMEPALRSREITLLDFLDKILETGVCAAGDLILSVANVNLVYISLRLLVSSVEALQEKGVSLDLPDSGIGRDEARPSRIGCDEMRPSGIGRDEMRPSSEGAPRVDVDPERVEKGLGQLVLTVVNLLRQLMERQALRKMEVGRLRNEEIENLGQVFMKLEERMEDLLRVFSLTREDLNLKLGPVCDLL
ncbi:MAG: gas vesicle protein K [Armatimonadetes bacterium]|nr:gas vesicle protein K [Armatimonadota bacterium]